MILEKECTRWHVISLPFFSSANSWTQSTCTKQSRWVKTLRMDCSPWIDKTNLIVEHVNPCGSLLLHVHPLQAQLCPPVCSSAHTGNYTLLHNISTIKWLNLKLWTPHIKDFSHYGEIETSVKIERQHQMLFIWGQWCWCPTDSTPSMFPPR